MRKPTSVRDTVRARLEELLGDRQARAVAGKGKLNEVTISRWKNGAFNPKLASLEKLAAGFGVTVAELVGPAPTFEEKLQALSTDEKLALARRLLAELDRERRDRS